MWFCSSAFRISPSWNSRQEWERLRRREKWALDFDWLRLYSVRIVDYTLANGLYIIEQQSIRGYISNIKHRQYYNLDYQIEQTIMSLIQQTPTLSDLYTAKRITFSSLRSLLQSDLTANPNPNFRQQISIISSLAYFLHQALEHELAAVEKFKHEVFYVMLENRLPRYGDGMPTKKHHHKKVHRVRKVDITINEILQQAVYEGLALSKSPETSMQVEWNSNLPSGNNLVTLPPFDANTIAELTQNIAKPADLPIELSQEPNKLEGYQHWLALTQRGIDISNIPQRPPKTKKKKNSNQDGGRDNKIMVSQGQLSDLILEKLATKVKASKSSFGKFGKDFFACLDSMHSILSDSDRMVVLLKKKEKKFPRKPTANIFQGNFVREMFDSPEMQLSSKGKTSFSESTDKVAERVVKKALETIFVTAPATSFGELCKVCPTMGKADIFHELLHLDFPIQQQDPASFSEITISKN